LVCETAAGSIFRLDIVRLGKYEAAPARRQTRRVLAKATELVLDPLRPGAIAQLGERLHGMQEVSGSIPLGSTNFLHLVSAVAGSRPVASKFSKGFANQVSRFLAFPSKSRPEIGRYYQKCSVLLPILGLE
jgi:hypothetical protein